MIYRFDVQYWSYEQALELPFGLRCCSANGVLPEEAGGKENQEYSPDGPVEGKERDAFKSDLARGESLPEAP